jgi:hypothetical protein
VNGKALRVRSRACPRRRRRRRTATAGAGSPRAWVASRAAAAAAPCSPRRRRSRWSGRRWRALGAAEPAAWARAGPRRTAVACGAPTPGLACGPRRPCRCRERRWRTWVTASLPNLTRCHLSTAICACGSARRIPDAYGADGSITTVSTMPRKCSVCRPSQVRTHAPDRPGASPSSTPAPAVSASTNEVSHGSDRRHPCGSSSHRTRRARVSSTPSTRVGVGSGSHLAAARTSAVCAVCHDTPYSRHTSATDRFRRGDRSRQLLP